MEVAAKSDSKRMYSWWWDSHNTPKNSKWLQENLADMDSNVKQMIKVLEEDADSFAMRAEMYYRKRPELMKLVEEFYRAYRALAERYNHATGVIHKAHETIAEAFPNQVPLIFGTDESSSHVGALSHDVDPQTPELQKDALWSSLSRFHDVKRNLGFSSEESSFVSSGKARKGLNFNDGDDKVRNDLKAQILSESERAGKAEAEVAALKDSLTRMQAEKEASLEQFEKNMERLFNLESEVSRAKEDSRRLNDKAASAEDEIQTLRETLNKLESEKESSFLQYQKCMQKIADLEDGKSVAQKKAGEINERASKAEAENIALKQSLAEAETDKEAALVQYKQCLATISNLEERLKKAEEDARLINERAVTAGLEVEKLKETISKLIKDKEASELQYQQCLNIIADLKLKLHHAREETQSLSHEIEDGIAKLKFSEEKCLVLEKSNQNLHSDLDGLLEKLGEHNQNLAEKQTELVKLWSCVREENLRFQEAESAFQTLRQLHSQSQEELNNLAVELQTRSQIMKDMEIRNSELHEEIQQAKLENKGLSELNSSSVASIKSWQEDVSSLKETIQKLEAEVKLRVDQRNASQQEILRLKELSQVGKRDQSMAENVEVVGSSFKELQEETSTLEECNGREKCEKTETDETLIGAEAYKNLVSKNASKDLEIEKLKGSQATAMLHESIKSLEDYVFVRRESEDELSQGADSMDVFPKLENMCLRIKAIAEAIMEKEKFLMLENSNAYSMLEASLKQIKELKTSGRNMRKQEGANGKIRKPSHEIEMVMKDIVLDQTSDGSSYEIVSKKGTSDLDHHGYVELKPVKTHKTETAVKAAAEGKSLSEESLVLDKVEIFDGFMDPNREVNKRKVLERLDTDLQKLENLQITVEDLKSKVESVEKEKSKVGEEEYATIKRQLEEAEESIEKLFNVNRKLKTKAESKKETDDRRKRISEQARRGSEKTGRLQLEIQRIQFLLMKLEGEREKEQQARSKISDTKSKVLLRDYIYGRARSVSMKKKTKKRAVFCGCAQQPESP